MDNEHLISKPSEDKQSSFSLNTLVIPAAVDLPDGTKRVPLASGTIISLLGVGGTATVYEIWNPKLEMKRAVKLMHPNYTLDSKQRFDTEIKISANLHHPNIVEVYTVGEWNGLPFIEMEKIEGSTLHRLIIDRGGLPIEVCTSIGILIGRALTYAHQLEYTLYGQTYIGVIHRDLKPTNIMVSRSGIVKLMDFGIARPIDASLHTVDSSLVFGTIQYVSPELMEGKQPDIRTDLYSLGAVLYETLTATRAFPETNISTLMTKKVRNEYLPLDLFAIKIPPRLKRLIHKCLSRDRDKRFASADEYLSEIAVLHNKITSLSPEEVMIKFMADDGETKSVIRHRRRLPRWLPALFLAIVAVFFATVFLTRFLKEHPRPAAPPLVQAPAPKPAPPAIKPENESVTKPPDLNYGFLKLNVDPVDATIFLDGKKVPVGRLLNGTQLKTGRHLITASASGFSPFRKSIIIKPNDQQDVSISLRRLEEGTGLLHVYSYPWAEIYIDNILRGTAPTPNPISLSTGEHSLMLKRDGFKTYSGTVMVTKGELARVKIKMEQ